jgi:hypothetical protein
MHPLEFRAINFNHLPRGVLRCVIGQCGNKVLGARHHSRLLFQCVSDRLSVRNILVDDCDRVAVLRERETNLIDDLAVVPSAETVSLKRTISLLPCFNTISAEFGPVKLTVAVSK